MSCCGDKRSPRRAAFFAAPSPVTPKPPAGGVALRYLGSTPILVRGPVSQAAYSFAAGGVSQVDPQDVDALLRTRLFRREP